MKNMKKNVVAMLITVIVFAVCAPSFAGGGATGGATEITQKLNNLELVESIRKATEQIRNQITQITNQVTQITNQIQMIQDMVKNTLALPSQLFGEVMGIVNKVKGVYEQTKGIIYSMANIEGVLKERFQSYTDMLDNESPVNYEEQYKKITETRQETVTSTMKALGVMYDQYTSDAEMLSQLQKKAESAEGRNQILQAANQLNAFAAQELMKLRELTMLQTSMTATLAAAERTQQDLERAKMIESLRVREREKYAPTPFWEPFK